MGILTWLSGLTAAGQVSEEAVNNAVFFNLTAELCVRELAFQSAVNLIANAVGKCEFCTYSKGKEVKGPEYYLWNIRPNRNQNSSGFIHKWIYQLYRYNEALIIEEDGQLLVADSFTKDEFALLDYRFSGVMVDAFTFSKTYYMSNVLYYRLNNKDINRLLGALYESYGKLLAYGMKTYQRAKGSKGKLKISSAARQQKDFEATFKKMTGIDFKTFFEADNAVIPLYDGFDYEEITNKTYSSETSRDIRAMVDDIYDFTARALCIPPALLRGEIADTNQTVNNLLTFCIDPLTDMLAEEINGKRTGETAYLAGTGLRIDTRTIEHIDLLSAAPNIDKLISSGTFCINDVRKVLGEPEIDEPWAKQHFVTKNYATIEEFLRQLKGGET